MTGCERAYQHRPHSFVDAAGVDHDCDGGRPVKPLAELLAEQPTLAGVGTAARIHELGVACA